VLLFTQMTILLLLGIVFVQDMMYRAVTWYVFPLLAAGFLCLQLLTGGALMTIWQPVLINAGFVLLLLLLLCLYFFLKQGRWMNITKDYLGMADILFWGAVACYLSVLNFLFFFMISLSCIILLWLPWKQGAKNKYIPLAGLQSLMLIVFLGGDWWHYHLRITDDQWLLRILIIS
jgi:hypothetical protein